MKKNKLLASIFLMLLITCQTKAQINTVVNQAKKIAYWQISYRAGFDVPSYNNNTPYIDYKGGISTGLSINHYWSWIGLGADVDYIKNKPKSIYPTNNLVNAASVSLTSFTLSEKSITRLFYGIGPSFKYQTPSGKLITELNTRVGLGSIKGGRTELRETSTLSNDLLNFHAGYDVKNVFSTKAQLQLNYFLNNTFGINFGAYYLRHFKASELVDPILNIAAHYQPIKTTSGINNYDGGYMTRVKSCNCDVSSIGAFAGVSIKLGGKKKIRPEDCEPEYSLVVTAKDKITGAILPGTEVVIKSKNGLNNKSAITNGYGVVVFEHIKPFDYEIDGTLSNIALEGNKASTGEFMKNKALQKIILYTDKGFIIKGKVFECNTTKAIDGITVVLENAASAYKVTTLTDADGSFMIHLPQAGSFSLYGKKGNYFSQIEEVIATNYDRNKNLFIKLEMCADKVDCGKAIKLQNILFDLDKYVIKEAAKPELNKLVRFMKDNPTIKVEVGSHTDCRASAEYNQTLSQNRANASVDYVISQGIDKSRITGKGYGESKLLNECADGVNCTEAQHSINRRTEMKVICGN